MSSPYLGILDLLQSPSKGCFNGHPKKKVLGSKTLGTNVLELKFVLCS